MIITFTVDAVPVAQPRQRMTIMNTGKNKFIKSYVPGNHPVVHYKAYTAWLGRRAAQKLNHADRLSLQEDPLVLSLIFYLPRPKSKNKKNFADELPHTSRPDVDNLFKSTVDALTGVLWKDDKQIFATTIKKFYHKRGDMPRVIVDVQTDTKKGF